MSSGNSKSERITNRGGAREEWVDLRKRYDDPKAFNAVKTRFPLRYRQLVEQYYRSFQETAAE